MTTPRIEEPGGAVAVAYRMRPFVHPSAVALRARARSVGLALALVSGLALATPDEPAQHEIDHLLEFVAASNCTFVRSGEKFAAPAARDHLAMKYRFAQFRLSTADEFVKYLATESSTTGEPYTVICGKEERPAGAWLAQELRRFRKVAAQSAPAR